MKRGNWREESYHCSWRGTFGSRDLVLFSSIIRESWNIYGNIDQDDRKRIPDRLSQLFPEWETSTPENEGGTVKTKICI